MRRTEQLHGGARGGPQLSTAARLVLTFAAILALFGVALAVVLHEMGEMERLEHEEARLDQAKHAGHRVAALVLDQYNHQAHTVIEWNRSHLDHYQDVARVTASAAQELSTHARTPEDRALAAATLPSTELLGRSAAMQRVLDGVARAAASDAPVLIAGESGTGKELVALTIHGGSARGVRRFVPVYCGGLGEAAADAELFGRVRGTVVGAVGAKRGAFEEAAGGALYLDEIDALPLSVQARLTRAIEERRIRRLGSAEEHAVDVRILAACGVDLGRAVERGGFRAELFDRLNVLSLEVPPLRERREDIPALAQAALRRAALPGTSPRTLSDEALDALLAYDWPGNVRQLENAMARAAAASPAETVSVDALPSEVRQGTPPSPRAPSLAALPYREALATQRERATREYLVALLADVHGNVTHAAERAGIERESFHRLMKRHGVRAEDFRSK